MKKFSTFFALIFVGFVLLNTSSVFAKRKYKPKKMPESFNVSGAIFDIDVSGIATGTAFNSQFQNNPPQLLYTITNLGSIYESGYATLPCPNNPNYSCWENRGFRTQIPPASCDGNPHTLSVYASANLGFGFNTPIARKTFVCYRADSLDKIPDRTPVIFIPGIGGSILAERNDDGTETVLFPNRVITGIGLERLDVSLNANIIATDAVRVIPTVGQNIYGEFIEDNLVGEGEFVEYVVNNIPERRTLEGCQSEQQRSNKPTLFVFAYDWRLSNGENSQKLYQYIQCVQKIYPGTNVDIVAHSMGGLLARRYLLDYTLSHHVNKMITIGSPYLGAPKAIDVLLTGRFLGKETVFGGFYLHKNKIKQLALFAKGMHELLPSKWYFALGGRPLSENIDANGNGIFPEIYSTHDIAANWLDTNFPFNTDNSRPYQNSANFHDFPQINSQSGQDDWREDVAGVEYYHLYGQKFGIPDNIDGTIGEVIIDSIKNRSAIDIRERYNYNKGYTYGDGTVPLLSSEREIGNFSLNFGEAILYPFNATNQAENQSVDHNGLMENQVVFGRVLSIVGDSETLSFMKNAKYVNNFEKPIPPARGASLEEVTAYTEKVKELEKKQIQYFEEQKALGYPNAPENFSSEKNTKFTGNIKKPISPIRPAGKLSREERKAYLEKISVYMEKAKEYVEEQKALGFPNSPEKFYLDITGVDRLDITDSQGNTNTNLGNADIAVPGVFYDYGSEAGENLVVPHEVVMPLDNTFDIKFRTSSDIMEIKIVKGVSQKIGSRVIKYLDMNLPVGVIAWLRFTPQGVVDLRYDADGDGNFESTLAPTYDLTGTAANDFTAPLINIQTEVSGNTATVSITASDNETGVKEIYYQVKDGDIPRLYTAPFTINLSQSKYITAYAEDNAGNRRSAFKQFDFISPTSTANTSPVPTNDGWHNSSVDVNFSAVDDAGGSGVREIVYSASGATQIPETSLFVSREPFAFPRPSAATDILSAIANISGEGITTLTYFAKDNQGNAELPKTIEIKIDYEAPRSSANVSVNGNTANISLSATDVKLVWNPQTEQYEPNPNFPVSGISVIKYSIDGGAAQNYSASFNFTGTAGTHTLRYFSVDRAGNVEGEKFETFILTAPSEPMSLRPILECVTQNSDGTFTAYFGYENNNASAVTILVGGHNKFTPAPQDKGQPTVFQPGVFRNLFSVRFNSNHLTWSVKGPDNIRRDVRASSSSPRCQ